VQYQRLGLSHLGRALLDQAFAATPTSTRNIACKPLPYVFAPLGLLPQPRTPQRVISEIEALATSTDLSIRAIQKKIAGRASRAIVGEITKRARAVQLEAL